MKEVIHFEDLWVKAEDKSKHILKDDKEILGHLSSIVNELKDIYSVSEKSNDKVLVLGIKSKAVGRLLFTLTALSAKENLDVYKSLKDQLDVLEIQNKLNEVAGISLEENPNQSSEASLTNWFSPQQS